MRSGRMSNFRCVRKLVLAAALMPLACAGTLSALDASRIPSGGNDATSATTDPQEEQTPAVPAGLEGAVATVQNANARAWKWVEVPGARCGNGSPAGFAINPEPNSDRLLVMFEGGGACWDAATCYLVKTAANVDATIDAASFSANQQKLADGALLPTARGNATNPFRNINLAFIPYCTGDLHNGNNVITYPFAPHPTYHVGSVNSLLFLEVLAAAMPRTSYVAVAGYSAGGFGAVLNFEEAKATFRHARVDIIADSAESVAGVLEHGSWKSAVPASIPGLDAGNFSTLLPAYAQANPNSRFAALSFETDTVLPSFEFMSADAFRAQVTDEFAGIRSHANAKTLLAPGADHVVLTHPDLSVGGVGLGAWLADMLAADPAWSSLPASP